MKTIILFLFLSLNLFAQSPLLTLFDSEVGVSYDADVETYLTVATALSDSQKTNVNDFVVMLKDSLGIANLSDKFDLLYLLANEDSVSSKLNLVKRDFDGVVFGAMTFTKWQGWLSGVDISKYMNTTFNDSTDGVASTLNSSHLAFYSRTNTDGGDQDIGYANSTTDVANRLFISLIGTRYYVSIHSAFDGGWVANNVYWGLFVGSRTASNVTKAYRGGDSLATFSAVSKQLINTNMIVCGSYNDGVVGTSRQHSFISIGAGLTTIEVRKLNNCVEAYLDNLGAGVQ